MVNEDEGRDIRRTGLQEEERKKGQVSQRRYDESVRDARRRVPERILRC